jgi:dienelactone hydrolase
MLGVTACNSAGARHADACGPFGDAPATIIGGPKTGCGNGKLLGPWKDSDGTDRYACLYEPVLAGTRSRLPLLIYLQPSLFSAEVTIEKTKLLTLQNTAVLSGESTRPGFIVLAPQGRRTTHYYPFPDNRGMGWDNWYRQLDPAGAQKMGGRVYTENVDAATIDHFVAQVATSGGVDTHRIYVTGWSNGAAMGLLYALNRPNIAAAAVYSAPNPFGAFDDPCPQEPVAHTPAGTTQIRIVNPHVPAMHVHNACDIVGICPNGEKLASQLRSAGVSIRDVIIDSSQKAVDQCIAYCGTNPDGDANLLQNPAGWTLGLSHHSKWPLAWTPEMLRFFNDNPLRPARVPF